MKISVVGRHPTLEHGFNGLMSINWLRGFYSHGVTVELLLPKSLVHDPKRLLESKGLKNFDQLERWGADFEIREISDSDDVSKDTDVVVWQSYRPEESGLLKDLRRNDFFLTKNPPRVFSGDPLHDKKKAQGLCGQFDLVALSLRADLSEAESIGVMPQKFSYVPRGFDDSILSGSFRNSVPTIGFDRAVKAEDGGERAMRHIVGAGKILRDRIPEVSYLSLRETVADLNSQRVGSLPFNDFYNQFINRLWIYMPIDFMHSVHRKGYWVDKAGGHRFIGLYENQVVEAQLAGALILGRMGDIPDELIMLPDDSLVESYDEMDLIVDKLIAHIENFEVRSLATRSRALELHSIGNSSRLYLSSINRLLNNSLSWD